MKSISGLAPSKCRNYQVQGTLLYLLLEKVIPSKLTSDPSVLVTGLKHAKYFIHIIVVIFTTSFRTKRQVPNCYDSNFLVFKITFIACLVRYFEEHYTYCPHCKCWKFKIYPNVEYNREMTQAGNTSLLSD
jgi:hypothetical protein